jgi:hypothetical protein
MAPKYRVRYVDTHFNERFAKLPRAADGERESIYVRVGELLSRI